MSAKAKDISTCQTIMRDGLSDDKNGKKHTKETHYLNYGEEDEMEIYGFKKNNIKTVITWLFIFSTAGLLRLIFHWYPHWMLLATHSECRLQDAEKVLIVESYLGKYKSYFVKNVKTLSTSDISENGVTNDAIINENKSEHRKMKIYLNDGSSKEVQTIRTIWCKKLCYIWDDGKEKFLKLTGLCRSLYKSELHDFDGFDAKEQRYRRVAYGYNEIQVPVQSIPTLLILEALNPFYIFQVFTLVVWFCEGYLYYTIAIILMSVFGISSSIIQTRKNQKNLQGTVHSVDTVRVCRGKNYGSKNGLKEDGEMYEDIPTSHLVPGDVIVIPARGCTVQCDCALLQGVCIVNESMLTGESVPVTKTSLPNLKDVKYDIKDDTNHTLYCGTKVIQTRNYGGGDAKAVVIRTGFLTTKGQLVRSILYPPPADFKFDQDSYKFIGILAVIAAAGLVYTVFLKSARGISATDIVLKALDLITIVIPPALPAAMTVGKLYALSRLKKKNIFCMNSRIINVSGSINCVCFDKTGTLTEDGLDMWGVVPIEKSKDENGSAALGLLITDPSKGLSSEDELLRGMVTCHSLTIIDDNLCGDPLDVKMFESTGWVLEEPTGSNNSKFGHFVPTVVKPPGTEPSCELGVIHQYQFSSTLQRMSVVTQIFGHNEFVVYCKGSPEMIMSLSKPETIPGDILEELKFHTKQGYRVIAMGTKVLKDISYPKLQTMTRDEIEYDLEFIGLIILENRLKPETTEIIKTLKNADIKIVMITGDNVQTALSVAKECEIIGVGDQIVHVTAKKATKANQTELFYTVPGSMLPRKSLAETKRLSIPTNIATLESRGSVHKYVFAMTGKTWDIVRDEYPHELPKLVTRGVVFARMSSTQKQQLVQELQNLGYYVAMCGDGANDCGALKAAHAGISLSEAEASVASPFTSKEANISCVPRVIREGRSALVTSFGVFKFMVAYALTEFTSVLILYHIDGNLTDLQFLFIDICLVVNFAFFFGRTKAYKGELVKQPPQTSLLGFTPMISLILHMAAMITCQILPFEIVQRFNWFEPFKYNPKFEKRYASHQNYAVFAISMFQYIIMAVTFSQGKPYRRPMYTNVPFTSSIIIMTIVCCYITLYPSNWITHAFDLHLPPDFNFSVLLLGIAVGNLIICLFFEDFIVNFVVHKKMKSKFTNLDKTSKKYLKIEKEIDDCETDWPPVGNEVPFLTPTPGCEIAVPRFGIDNVAFISDDNVTTKV